jgi:hypothetical protein
MPGLTSGTQVVDELIDGVRIGDNLVLQHRPTFLRRLAEVTQVVVELREEGLRGLDGEGRPPPSCAACWTARSTAVPRPSTRGMR